MTSDDNSAGSTDGPATSLDETLIAYLDHELSADERATFEQRMQHDSGLRRRRDEFLATWQLLDTLELAAPNEAFTRTTMSMACVSLNEPAWRRIFHGSPKFVRFVAVAVSTAALILTGMFIGGRIYRSQQLADLPLIENVDIYLSVADIGDVRTIATTEPFGMPAENLPSDAIADSSGEDVVADEGSGVTVQTALGNLTDRTEIQRMVQELSGPEREALAAKRRRFDELPAVKQSALRELHTEIFSTDNGVLLYASLIRYHDWLKSLPAGQRADLMKLSVNDRLEKATEWMQQDQRSGEFGTVAGWVKGDGTDFRRWWNEYLRRYGPEIAKQLPPRDTTDRERRPVENRPFREGARPEFVRRIIRAQAAGQLELPLPTRQEFLGLREELKPEALDRLDKETSLWTEQFQRVARVAFLGMVPQRIPLVAPAELQRFYLEDLSPGQRERLDRLPADRMHFELRQLYLHRYGRRAPRNPNP